MGPKRRRSSPWPLLGVSLLLLLAPSSATQKLRLTAMAGFSPFRWVGRTAAGAPGRVLPSSGRAGELQTENDYLKDQVQKLDNEVKRLKILLEQTSGLKQSVWDPNLRVLHAEVMFPTDGSPWRKSLTLGLGSRAGLSKGMLVLYNNQVVGRIIEAGPWASRVQTVTDPGFRARAVAVPRPYTAGVSLGERHVGVYEGTAGQNGSLKWLTGDTPVENHAFIVTTEDPENGIPRGLILGRVANVNTGRGVSPKVDVEPILNFRGLETVMVLVPPAPPVTAGVGTRP